VRLRFEHLLDGFSARISSDTFVSLKENLGALLDQFNDRRNRAGASEQAKAADSHESIRGPGKLQERFALVLDAFSKTVTERRAALAADGVQIRAFLEQFSEHRSRADAMEHANTVQGRNQFHTLLDAFNETLEHYRLHQEQVADDFNLLDVMRLTGKEVRHSMVLAWLLDSDMRNLGTHAQGNLGFRLFLDEFGLPSHYAHSKYWVRREVPGDESVVDVEIGSRGGFLIHIENKIWSGEGTVQTDREWSDLQRRADNLTVPAHAVHAFFLTPHGAKPANQNFCAIPWGRIVRVLEKFANQAKPAEVRLFASHYARALRRFIVFQDISEDGNGKATLE
jgi:PD-(D/E)XK nuclease superfamily protein